METIGATQTAQSLREAFSQRGGDETRYARAALLLGLGLMLHPPSDESKQDFVEDAELEWPRVHELERPIESPFENDIVQELEADRKKFGQIAVEERWMGNLIKMLYEDGPDQATNAAFGLIRLSMNSEDPLLRAAACLSWMDTTNQPNEALMHLATIAMSHENNLARFIAIRGLFRLIEPPPSEPRMTPIFNHHQSALRSKHCRP